MNSEIRTLLEEIDSSSNSLSKRIEGSLYKKEFDIYKTLNIPKNQKGSIIPKAFYMNKDIFKDEREKEKPHFLQKISVKKKSSSKDNRKILDRININNNDLKNRLSISRNYIPLSERVHHPTPEPGKYNPNYKSIYKKIPNVIIRKPTNLKENHLLSVKQVEPPQTERKSHKLTTQSLKIPVKIEKGLDFSQCTPRKDILLNQIQSKIVSYIDPDKITKNERKSVHSIDFSKMKTRNFEDFLTSRNVPGVATYYPNFEAISTSRKSILPYKNEENYKKNKLIVQKMWRSYNVSVDYQTVKFNSFLKEIHSKPKKR